MINYMDRDFAANCKGRLNPAWRLEPNRSWCWAGRVLANMAHEGNARGALPKP
jgi:hypothetical protein